MENSYFKINIPKVVHQFIESEVIAIHMERGNYYSLKGSSLVVWQGLEAGFSKEEVIESLVKDVKESDKKNCAQEVAEFIAQLSKEDLIIPADPNNTSVQRGNEKIFSNHNYSKPIMEKYTDMQEFITVDPIHEVGDLGWPHIKKDLPDKNS